MFGREDTCNDNVWECYAVSESGSTIRVQWEDYGSNALFVVPYHGHCYRLLPSVVTNTANEVKQQTRQTEHNVGVNKVTLSRAGVGRGSGMLVLGRPDPEMDR